MPVVKSMLAALAPSTIPLVLGFFLGGIILAACGEEQTTTRGFGGSGRSGKASSAKGGRKQNKAKRKNRNKNRRENKNQELELPDVDEWVVPLQDTELRETVFIETDENRDPFRSFLNVFTAQALPDESEFAPRPPVLLEDVSLDELRLIAIVSGEGGNPRAMVVDPDGKGWIVRRGDYVGRGEKIRLGPGQPEREINWRVVRVRPDRIILVREDPVQAGPPVTRVMRLYPEEET